MLPALLYARTLGLPGHKLFGAGSLIVHQGLFEQMISSSSNVPKNGQELPRVAVTVRNQPALREGRGVRSEVFSISNINASAARLGAWAASTMKWSQDGPCSLGPP